MELEKLIRNVKQELKEIGEQGLNASNLDTVGKLSDIYKDLKKAESYDREDYSMTRYKEGDYSPYREREYGAMSRYEEGYGRMYREKPYGSYGGSDARIKEHMDRIMDGAEQYEYGRSRYRHGDSEERVLDGLEKLMYSICMFVESTYEFAQTPQEKEVIRKHIHKMKNL